MTIRISRNDNPIESFEDWEKHAAPKGKSKQWVDGRSAKECARAWTMPTVSVPAELDRLLASHPDFNGTHITEVLPEHRIAFDQLGEPRNADVAVIAQRGDELIAITIEAKADESFDRPVAAVRKTAQAKKDRGERTRAIDRIDLLLPALFSPVVGRSELDRVRYQLVTAVAGTLAFAANLEATRALLVIHEFTSTGEKGTKERSLQGNQRDLDFFVRLLDPSIDQGVAKDRIVGPIRVPGGALFKNVVPLYLGKISRSL